MTIAGKYRLYAKIGTGGMGAVYRATRLLIGDEVAVKILHFEQDDPKAAERFRREAQAAARLKHPNAVNIYDFGVTDDGLQYLVMELVEGESLRQVIKQQGPLSPSASAEIIGQVCAALDEAHRHNIIHRDIKPDNIIVNPLAMGVRVKVLDFGIAKLRDDAVGSLTQTGNILGTPHYMSPEQCLGEELDSRADIYSLGVVLYEMLIGVAPFNSPTPSAVVIQHVNQKPSSLRERNPGISESVERAALWALEKRRENRPQSAGEYGRAVNLAVHDDNRSSFISTSAATKPPQSTSDSGLRATEVLSAPSWAFGNVSPSTVPGLGTNDIASRTRRHKTWLFVAGALLFLVSLGLYLMLHSNKLSTSIPIRPDYSKLVVHSVLSGEFNSTIKSIAFSPDGKTLAIGAGQDSEWNKYDQILTTHPTEIILFDPETRQYKNRLNGQLEPATALAFAPDGKSLATGTSGSLAVWDWQAGRALRSRKSDQPLNVEQLVFSPDGENINILSNQTILTWRPSTGTLSTALRMTGGLARCSISTDATMVACAVTGVNFVPVDIELWQMSSSNIKQRFAGYTSDVRALAISSNKKLLAAGLASGEVRLWDSETGSSLKTISAHTDAVERLTFSPDSLTLASGGSDKTVKLWDVQTGALLKTLTEHGGYNNLIAFTSDNQTVAVATFDTVVLWKTNK